MRLFRLILMLGAIGFGAGFAGPAAHAGSGNVLVPSDDSEASGLGLLPAAPAPGNTTSASDSSATKKKDESPAPLLPEANSEPVPATSSTPADLPYTPTPVSMAMPQLPSVPTQVLQMPVNNAPPDPDLPNAMNISVADKYSWGPLDVATVQGRLGIAPNQVSGFCRLSVGGVAVSDQGAYSINASTGSHTGFRYDGTLSGLRLIVQALCDLVPLPPNAGLVTQYGDKYLVSLSQVACDPPPSGAKRLTFAYAGDGTGSCQYK
jgi:hypothetical protein